MKDLDQITDWDEYKKAKKQNNFEYAISKLEDSQIYFEYLSESHIRVLSWDYWPSTGLFIHMKSKRRGRGINKLMKLISDEVGASKN